MLRKLQKATAKMQQITIKEKAACSDLPQLAESVRLATPLARFDKIVRTASKQRVGSSSLPWRSKGPWINEPPGTMPLLFWVHLRPLGDRSKLTPRSAGEHFGKLSE